VYTGTTGTGTVIQSISGDSSAADDSISTTNSIAETVNGKTYNTSYTQTADSPIAMTKITKSSDPANAANTKTTKTTALDPFGRVGSSTVHVNSSDIFKTTYTYSGDTTKNPQTTSNQICTSDIKGTNFGELKSDYTYDKNGNILTVTQNGVMQYSYVYNALNELTRYNDIQNQKSYFYSYNNQGTAMAVTTFSGCTFDGKGTLLSYTGNPSSASSSINTNWPDEVVAVSNGVPITYDTAGNMKTYNGATYGWTQGRELTSYTKGSTSVSYKYNAAGLRTSKTVNGVVSVKLVLSKDD